MSLIARAATRQTVALRQTIGRRGFHVENVVGNNTPFSYQNKTTFAIKTFLFLSTGFAIPFIAVAWQVKKSKGA